MIHMYIKPENCIYKLSIRPVYAYIYTHIHTRTYIHTYVYMYIYTHIRINTYTSKKMLDRETMQINIEKTPFK